MAKKKKVLTEQQIIQRVSDSECPACGASDGFESGEDTTYDSGIVTCVGTCSNCGARWVEEYAISAVYIDPTDTEPQIEANDANNPQAAKDRLEMLIHAVKMLEQNPNEAMVKRTVAKMRKLIPVTP